MLLLVPAMDQPTAHPELPLALPAHRQLGPLLVLMHHHPKAFVASTKAAPELIH